MDSLFEQTRGICLDRASVGGGLACELGLNLGRDVNGNRHVPSFQAMLLPYPVAVPPVNWRNVPHVGADMRGGEIAKFRLTLFALFARTRFAPARFSWPSLL